MRNLTFFILLASLFMGDSKASSTSLGEITSLPTSKLLFNAENKPVIFIDTGEITDAQGLPARGPHEVTFTLASAAKYPVNVHGTVIQPGGSFTKLYNLSHSNHQLIIPIQPATNSVDGLAPFTVKVENLNVNACPQGFNESSGGCLRVLYEPVSYSCPSSFSMNDSAKKCQKVSVVELTHKCPETHSQSGDSCTRKIKAPFEYKCSSGMVEGANCIHQNIEEAKSCSGLSTLNEDGLCELVLNSYTATKCPTGFESNFGGSCSKTHVVDAHNYTCPTSHPVRSSYGDNRCYKFEPGKSKPGSVSESAHCGFSFSKTEDGRCASSVRATAACLDGYTFLDGVCSRVEVVEQGNYCGDRKQTSEFCVEAEITEPIVVCRDGYTYSNEFKACLQETSTPATKICPGSFVMNNQQSMCEQTETINLVISCPAGYEREVSKNICVEKKQTAATQSCPAGSAWTKSGTACNYYDLKPIDSCASGHVLRSGKCHKVASKSQRCDSGYTNNGSGTCYRNETGAATPTCSAGYTYSSANKRCEKTTKYTATRSCQPGYTLNSSNICVKSSIQEPVIVYSCSSGTLTGTQCSKVSEPNLRCHIQMPVQCDGGRGWVVGPEVVEETTTSCTFMDREHCGNGWSVTLGKRASCPFGSTLESGMCHGSVPATETPTCPSQHSLSGGKCVYNQTANPTYSCPQGGSYIGSNQCSRLDTSPNSWSCGSGWALSGSTCSRQLTAPVNYFCSSGESELNGTQCYSTEPNNSAGKCPTNYSLKPSIPACERSYSQEVSYSCPNDNRWTLNKNICNWHDEKALNINCPVGHAVEPGKSGCRKLFEQEPQRVCSDRYSLDMQGERCFNETWTPRL